MPAAPNQVTMRSCLLVALASTGALGAASHVMTHARPFAHGAHVRTRPSAIRAMADGDDGVTIRVRKPDAAAPTAPLAADASVKVTVRAPAAAGAAAAGRTAASTATTVTVRTLAAGAAPPAAPPPADASVKVTVRAPAAAGAAAAARTAASTDATVTVRPPAETPAIPAFSDPLAPPPPPPRSADDEILEAARSGSIRALKDALARGARPDATDVQGFTPLHLCAATGLAPGVVLLARAGADLNARAQNLTPLTMAIGYNKPFTVETIVKCGARTNEPDAEGLTPEAFVADLIKAECERDADKKENILIRVVNKRLDALRSMEQALALAGEAKQLDPAAARANVDAMYAELDGMLDW
jgi:hypothetical protein